MRFWLYPVLLLALAPLRANELDPVEFFGAGHFRPAPDNDRAGTVTVTLTAPLPPFLDLFSSGEGDFADRFVPAATGLAIKADDKLHRTCEAALDLGADRLEAAVTVVELDRGATLAWHLRALNAEKDREYLCELRRNQQGEFSLQIRVGDGVNFRLLPGVSAALPGLELPATLAVKWIAGTLSLASGAVSASTTIANESGLRPGLAVSDGAARLRELSAMATFARLWVEDAGQRQAARRALHRLRELASGGLLAGVWAQPYPAGEEHRAEFDNELKLAPANTLAAAPGPRARELAAIAGKLPKNPLAQHMAGVAALLAGDVKAGLHMLRQADGITRTSVTSLALAEAERRSGATAAAEASLKAAKVGMPEALEPEYRLILGRLQATCGDLPAACATLEAAAKAWPDHEPLRDFALSARSLVQPEGLTELSKPGPLGLRLLSDLPEKQLAVLVARLQPYLDKFRVWLPKLARALEGTIVVYAGPVDYLNSALLVAGDNLDNVAGMYLPVGIDSKPTVLACRGFGEDDLLRTLVHELWHLAFAASGKGKDAPRWLNEGIAVYFSAGRMNNSVMVFDRVPAEFDEGGLTTDEAALRRAFGAGLDFYVPGEVRGNYLAGWAVVWHLMSSDEGTALLRRLVAGDAEAYKQLQDDAGKLTPKLAEKLARLARG